MVKRLFDLLLAALALVVLAPFLVIAAVGIRLSSSGPILYRAQRVGKSGERFTMHKFRTMRVEQGSTSVPITKLNDPRVFSFGRLLRHLKIDEFPQFYDVLRGKMSLIGPRPEDPRIVSEYYDAQGMESLSVLPGLASPGSVYYYTHGQQTVSGQDTEEDYVKRILPTKLALDVVYVREASMMYDLRIVLR